MYSRETASYIDTERKPEIGVCIYIYMYTYKCFAYSPTCIHTYMHTYERMKIYACLGI